MWTPLASAADIDAFLGRWNAFHDGSLGRIGIAGPGQAGDTNCSVVFQGYLAGGASVEIRCLGISDLRLRPSRQGHDSIVASGRVTAVDGIVTLAANFVGGPLKGPPGGSVFIPYRDLADPDLSVSARSMAWRELIGSLPPEERSAQ